MFYNVNHFPFLEPIINNVELIANEFERFQNSELLKDFMINDLPMMYSHAEYYALEQGISSSQINFDLRNEAWGTFPIYKNGFEIKQ